MATHKGRIPALLIIALFIFPSALAPVRAFQNQSSDQEFGPVVRAYLGYLKNEQEVVDDRVSRREVSCHVLPPQFQPHKSFAANGHSPGARE